MATYRPIDEASRPRALALIEERWGGTVMVVRGETVDMASLDGICAFENDTLIGLATYRILDMNTWELLSLDSLRGGRGIGSALIEQVAEQAKASGAKRLTLITTNDNLDALRLYQKRGFDLARLYRNSMDAVRKIKPGVPLIGQNGIPLRHELELVREL